MYAGRWDTAQQERNQRLAANVTGTILGLTPVLETGDDVLTLTTGCGYACQMGGEAPVGCGWRTVSGAALLALGVGGAIFRELHHVDETVQVSKSTARKRLVIGEGMEAVRTTALMKGANWYQAWSKYYKPETFDLEQSMARNERWIRAK